MWQPCKGPSGIRLQTCQHQQNTKARRDNQAGEAQGGGRGGGGGGGGALSAPDYSPLVEAGAWLSGVLKLAHPPPCRLANLQKLNCPLVLFLGAISTRLHNYTFHLARRRRNRNRTRTRTGKQKPETKTKTKTKPKNQSQNQNQNQNPRNRTNAKLFHTINYSHVRELFV